MGRLPSSVIREKYAHCRALVFPGEEDFGIVPIEAMASGRPVIAFRRGGALETVVEGRTGLFFDEQTEGSLLAAVERFEDIEETFDPADIRRHALGFDRQVFKAEFKARVDELMKDHQASLVRRAAAIQP
jgi:glycosyltransferase involved in cell wall biosynthesis